MNSRISIDVDHDNQPVIKIEYKDSDDVRDKLVKKFLETYGSASAWARTIWVEPRPDLTMNSTVIIRPIPPHAMDTEGDEMKQLFGYLPKMCAAPDVEKKKK